ncbi:hypothetical protein D3C80_1267380 [compost metagenome]
MRRFRQSPAPDYPPPSPPARRGNCRRKPLHFARQRPAGYRTPRWIRPVKPLRRGATGLNTRPSPAADSAANTGPALCRSYDGNPRFHWCPSEHGDTSPLRQFAHADRGPHESAHQTDSASQAPLRSLTRRTPPPTRTDLRLRIIHAAQTRLTPGYRSAAPGPLSRRG